LQIFRFYKADHAFILRVIQATRIPRKLPEAIMNIFKSLLFLQGHLIHDDADAATGIDVHARDTSASRHTDRRSGFGLVETLTLLGGRPMHPDQPFDREEPFEQLVESCCSV
jgi:hypothetical protein